MLCWFARVLGWHHNLQRGSACRRPGVLSLTGTRERVSLVRHIGREDATTPAMEQVIKVLLSFCKVYCGKNSPSEKEIAAVLSRLEREDMIKTPRDILNYQKWDAFTMALAQRAMSVRKSAELKTWGLILGALKAAREEKQFSDTVRVLLSLGQDPGNSFGDSLDPGGPSRPGESVSCRNPKDGLSVQEAPPLPFIDSCDAARVEQSQASAPAPLPPQPAPAPVLPPATASARPLAPVPARLPATDLLQAPVPALPQVRAPFLAPRRADPPHSAAAKMAPATPLASGATHQMPITAEECEGGVLQHPPSSSPIIARETLETPPLYPPPYPRQSLYPSLDDVSRAEIREGCIHPPRGGPSAPLGPPEGGVTSGKPVMQGGGIDGRARIEGGGESGRIQGGSSGRVRIADWAKIAETLDEKCLSEVVHAFPVAVQDDGEARWVPLDAKGVARLVDAVEKKGLRSPLTLNALESLTAPGPLLPHDIENLMRMILEPVQYTLWKEEWSTQLKTVLAAAENDLLHPAFGSNLHRLMGTAPGMCGTPHGQLALLRPGEVLVTSEAALAAFRKFARTAAPASPWTEIEQGPNESFQDFANRLMRAVEGSDLPRAVHNPVIVDCLKQKSAPLTNEGLAASTEQDLQALETRVIATLTTTRFRVSEQKIQRGPGVEYLGYKYGPDLVRPAGLNIQLKVSTLWDVQKLVGAIQWVRGALGIPPRLMKPFYDQLKGSNPKEPREFTPEMAAAWEEIMCTCLESSLSRFDSARNLELAVCRYEAGAAAVLGHSLSAKPQPLWWLFSTQLTRAYTSWLEILAMLLRKSRLLSVRALAKEPEVIYLQKAFRDASPLPETLLAGLQGWGGEIVYSDSLSIFELARPLKVSLRSRVLTSSIEGPTLFTDASSATCQGAVVWQDISNAWKSAVFMDQTVSVQMLEVRAVALAMRLFHDTPCNIVTDSAFAARLLVRMGQEGQPSSEAAGFLEEALARREAAVAVLHVRSHSDVPGFFTTGNAMADKVASTLVFTLREARDLHSTLHVGARALARACSIPLSVARDVVHTCPHCNSAPTISAGVNPRGLKPLQVWQTDFTWEQRFSPRAWLAVTIDTSSSVIVATQHAKSNSKAAQCHWAAAIAVMGLPSQIKTDKGSCFTSRSTQDWLALWGISHTTGIPGNSQGQAIVERANSLLKEKIRVLGEGEGYMGNIPVSRQAEILAKALYALNHFERGDNRRTPVQKHWQSKVLSEGPSVKVKRDDGTWEPGWMILVWGRGYAAVKHRDSGKIIWVPSRKVKPDVSETSDSKYVENEGINQDLSVLFAGVAPGEVEAVT
ncbi:uncharacterized protein LOC110401160 [Numida meleagris]|uniref:uncharacterized protein LOC110401160 n=1 Tax=Numida meleagris TaxID=8996 RepID=UPI000B3E2FD2|nr:uncharacterized protein LOC110401160 [Numida meleagris]